MYEIIWIPVAIIIPYPCLCTKKVLFSLMARPLPPPPLNGPAISGGIFFCGFPNLT